MENVNTCLGDARWCDRIESLWALALFVPALLLITGLAACWVPAQRAARVDPLVVLR